MFLWFVLDRDHLKNVSHSEYRGWESGSSAPVQIICTLDPEGAQKQLLLVRKDKHNMWFDKSSKVKPEIVLRSVAENNRILSMSKKLLNMAAMHIS